MRDSWKGLLPRPWAVSGEHRVHMDSPEVGPVVADALFQFGRTLLDGKGDIVLLCIGTDRSIGDSLGPLIGSQLTEAGGAPYIVYGTLEQPVHASNLADTLDHIHAAHIEPLIIAVDACLGRTESVGMISIGKGSLKPGAGVNKTLPAVGQIYVTGVVNVGGFMEYFVLQNTRLSLVMRMAKAASVGIGLGLSALAELRSPSRSFRRTEP